MLYGNSSMGFSFSPDRRNDKVNHDRPLSQFLGASGSRQGGYYHTVTTTYSSKPKTTGRYLGNGQYVED